MRGLVVNAASGCNGLLLTRFVNVWLVGFDTFVLVISGCTGLFLIISAKDRVSCLGAFVDEIILSDRLFNDLFIC